MIGPRIVYQTRFVFRVHGSNSPCFACSRIHAAFGRQIDTSGLPVVPMFGIMCSTVEPTQLPTPTCVRKSLRTVRTSVHKAQYETRRDVIDAVPDTLMSFRCSLKRKRVDQPQGILPVSGSAQAKPQQVERIKYASDCSGIEGAAMTLERLGIPYQTYWVSDIEQRCRNMIKTNYHDIPASKIFANVFRKPESAVCHVDVYTAGFPCQPFSNAGSKRGLRIDDDRSLVVFGVLATINQSRPKCFVLENVPKLMSQKHKALFNKVIQELKAIKTHRCGRSRSLYKLYVNTLNSAKHGSCQNRDRLYIVGVSVQATKPDAPEFCWPKEVAPTPLASILSESSVSGSPVLGSPEWMAGLPKDTTRLRNIAGGLARIISHHHGNPADEQWVCNAMNSPVFGIQVMLDKTPCLTKTRGYNGGFWLFAENRMTDIDELGLLQGFPRNRLRLAKGVGKAHLGGMYGNSFNVNTLMRIFCRLLPAVGLAYPVDPFGMESVDAAAAI